MNMYAWVKQSVAESARVEMRYSEMSEGLRREATRNISVYNAIYSESFEATDWTWFVSDGCIATRGYLL